MSKTRGFTLIELIVTVSIVAILAALAVPSFTSLFARKRVEGLASELVTDLQYARSEAVQRNTLVQVTLGTNCYVIHALPTSAIIASNRTCTQTGSPTVILGETVLKNVQVAAGTSASFAPTSGNIFFDPVRGLATISSGTDAITASSTTGSWALAAVLTVTGRVKTCVPSGSPSIAGYSSC